jgi:adenylate cyclase
MLRIVANPGQTDERSVDLRTGATTIGRTKENDVWVLHKSMSRQHARIDHDGNRTTLVDLDSKNGTFVNGQRVTRAEIAPGDSIRCGDVVFELVGPGGTVRAPTALDGGAAQPTTIAPIDRDVSRLGMEELLGRRVRDKLEVLLKVGQLLSSPRPIDELLDEVLALVLRIMDVDRAAVLLADETTGELVPRVLKTSRGATAGRFYSEHIVRWVRDHGAAALFADARQDERIGNAASILQQSIRSSMCAPLKPKDRLLGVLYVDNLTTPRRFGAEDLDFLVAFANQAAIALENSLLTRRLQDEAVLRSTLMRFFPPATIKRLQQSPGAALEVIETEVTALFSDVSDFTAMSAHMRPREVVDVLNDYFPRMADIVFRHGGTLEKYIGDALMAVWGAPFRDEADADNAVRAAVAMQRELVELNERWTASGKTPLRVHVGINTGVVAAGNIGSERYLQYATVGDATNVASRVCSAAGPGQILVAESTRLRLRDASLVLDPLPPVEVKGKDQPLQLHAVRW